jgi:hypothetical protein
MVATGEVHKVLGCIRVSWFSETSPKVFNNMRFLVSETAQVDLVIGTRSIQKEKLLNPPNLMAEIHHFNKSSGKDTCDADFAASPLRHTDSASESLVSNIAKLETDVLKAETKLQNTKEGTKEHASAEKTLKKAKNALKIANFKKDLHDVNLDLKKTVTKTTHEALVCRKKGLEAKLASKEKKEKKET